MSDSKISALPSATVPLAGTEVLPIVQSSVTDKVTAADLLRQNGQTVTTSNPVLSLAQTWNAGGVTFTADLINVTDTASAAASRLFARQVGGADRFVVLKSGAVSAYGNLTFFTDNTYDIGASGATRPRNIYVGSTVFTGGSIQVSTAGSYQFTGRGDIISNADGVFQLRDNAGTSFGRLQFGGTTSSFPALKRSSAALTLVLADDSAYASFNADTINASANRAIPAGGTTGAGLRLSSAANFGVFFGSGAPTLSAAQGSLYLRSDGSTTITRMYVNTDGSTTWTAVTTVL